jgi:hypothetical protein
VALLRRIFLKRIAKTENIPPLTPTLTVPFKPNDSTSGFKRHRLTTNIGINAMANTFSFTVVSNDELRCGHTFFLPHLLAVLEKNPSFFSQVGHLKNCSFSSNSSSIVSE